MNNYTKFFAMISTSTVVMLGLMYLNTYAIDHVTWSETRFYMAFLMGAVMALVMLSFMLEMYKDKTKNFLIYAGSITVFIGALFLVRSQITVGDQSYMNAMIPHHSIAIMTSERAGIKDVRVRTLANSIIKAQRKEIAEMKWLIDDINKNGVAKTESEALARPIPKIEGEVNPAEIDNVNNPIYKSKNK